MATASREFQVFVKPGGSACNLRCQYCYYLTKKSLYQGRTDFRMSDETLKAYITQHIDASDDEIISFSWHGGEPMLLGLSYFQKIVEFQRKYRPPGRRIRNGIQTNGTLIDQDWCRFFAREGFGVGLSLDGPKELHDAYRTTGNHGPTHEQVMHGYRLLQEHHVTFDILCVVHDQNVRYPAQVYRFFKEIGARYLGFLPLVERLPQAQGVSERSAPVEAFGIFLSTIFDEWLSQDIDRVKVQIFEETIRAAMGGDHGLCVFRKTCGNIPVVEHNGDVYSCDHFVDGAHRIGNIHETPLTDLLDTPAQVAFGQDKEDALPLFCKTCEVLPMCNGGCPKDRILRTPDGEEGLNYLCAGYKHFFTHCRPFTTELSRLWHEQQSGGRQSQAAGETAASGSKIGRNDPCPCGSGRKYKKCCLGKSQTY